MTNTVTFTSGYWANADQSCAICETVERGSVAVSVDRAELWAEMQTAIAAGALVVQAAPPIPSAVLASKIEAKWAAVSSGGTTVNVAAEGEPPIMAHAATNADGKADLLGMQAKAALGIPLTWYQSTGSFVLTAPQLQVIALGVASHVEAAIATWSALNIALAAGAITTLAQIEHPETVTFNGVPLPSWPSNL